RRLGRTPQSAFAGGVDSLSARESGLCLSAVQFDACFDRCRKRGRALAGGWGEKAAGSRARQRAPGYFGDGPSGPRVAFSAVGRGAAAGGLGPATGSRAEVDRLRRTDVSP